jgi:hypothetical protein
MSANNTVTATFTQYITVTAPTSGTIWARGTTQTITWTYAGSPGSTVKIQLLQGGAVNSTITSSTSIGSGGKGSYSWTIPSSLTAGSTYQISVTSTSNSNYTGISNGDFTLQ